MIPFFFLFQLSALFIPIFFSVADRFGDGLRELAFRLNASTMCEDNSSTSLDETNTSMTVERILDSQDRIVLGLKGTLPQVVLYM